MIKIISYSDVNDLKFGSTESEAIAKFGNYSIRRKNREGELELYFHDFILRFEATSGLFRECTLLPGCNASINETPIIWNQNFLSWLSREDTDLKEVVGFILSLKLGIAISGFHDEDESEKAIHAFRRGDWDMFSNKMKPFRII